MMAKYVSVSRPKPSGDLCGCPSGRAEVHPTQHTRPARSCDGDPAGADGGSHGRHGALVRIVCDLAAAVTRASSVCVL